MTFDDDPDWVTARSVPVTEDADLLGILDQFQMGQVVAWPIPDPGWEIRATVKPGLSEAWAARATVTRWPRGS